MQLAMRTACEVHGAPPHTELAALANRGSGGRISGSVGASAAPEMPLRRICEAIRHRCRADRPHPQRSCGSKTPATATGAWRLRAAGEKRLVAARSPSGS